MRDQSRLVTFLVCLGCFGSLISAGVSSTNENKVLKIDTYVNSLVECANITALSLAVVRNGQVILSKGYGYKTADKIQKTSSTTKFPIGGLTNAFTALLLAKTVRENATITFDTPIKNLFKNFWMRDDYQSKHATIRDLLGHRTTVRDNFFPVLLGYDPNLKRKDFARKLQYLKTSHSFREKYSYANGNYILATELLELVNSRSWEDQVKKNIFEPLVMTDSGFITQITDWNNFALPCDIKHGEVTDLPTDVLTTNQVAGGSGAIYSTADDMAKWINFFLSETKSSSGIDLKMKQATFERSIPAKYGKDLTKPKSNISDTIDSYCMGWFRGINRGYRKMFHSGGIATYRSYIQLYPDEKTGIFLAVNNPQTIEPYRRPIIQYISDVVMGLTPFEGHQSICAKILERDETTPVSCKSHSSRLNLTLYVGNYSRKDIGKVEITLDTKSNHLLLKYGNLSTLELCPESGTRGVFKGIFTGPLSYRNKISFMIMEFKFSFDKYNRVSSFFVGTFINIRFKKI